MNRPKLRTSALLFTLAGLLWIFAGFVEVRWLISVIYLLMFVSIGWGSFESLDYILFTVARRVKDFQEAGSAGRTRMLEMAIEYNNSIAGMDSDHLSYAGKLRPEMVYVPRGGQGTPGPVRTLRLPGGEDIDWDFVGEFSERSTGAYLAERRQWSEGSKRHTWADALTLYFVHDGYAVKSAGNQAAKWISAAAREAALVSIGYYSEAE
jgi:hypothetical protein